MLSELYIRDFAIITELRMTFGHGFNVLTGETGAGKSIILDAMSLIVGGRGETSFVRAGCEKAYVEAMFEIPDAVAPAVIALLHENELEDEDDPRLLTVTRELRLNGRNVCRINGTTVRTGLLRDLGEHLVGIHGQGEHLALLNAKAHLPLLDAFGGLVEEQKKLAADVRQLRRLERERADLRQNERTRQQRIDMYRFQVEEIDAAQLEVDEEEELRHERMRLSNMEQLLQAAAEATAVLIGMDGGDTETPTVSDLLSQGEAAVSTLARLDESQNDLLTRMQGLLSEFDEIGRELHDYLEELEHDPDRLNFIEARLEVINRLKRKYGSSIAEILQVRDEAAEALDQIEHSSERLGKLDGEIDKHLHTIGRAAAALSAQRQTAAKKLSDMVERELHDLKMTARFAVDFRIEEDAENGLYVDDKRPAFDHAGYDQVEFMLSANPGEPLKPMAKVASGGETARIMLALKTALAEVDATPTLIFDEIDQGIGGRIGTIVGQKLWSLAGLGAHQVIVVTHLPQMAGFGDMHFHVQKAVVDGRTSTRINQLDHHQRVDELGAMLGTNEDLAKVGARSILKEAAAVKEKMIGA